MASVLSKSVTSKIDPMCPEAVQARVSERARELANRTGGMAAPYAVDGFRTAYLALWNRFQNERLANADLDFFPDQIS